MYDTIMGPLLDRCVDRACSLFGLKPNGALVTRNDVLVVAAHQRWGDDKTYGGTLASEVVHDNPVYALTVAVFGPDGSCICFTDGVFLYHIKEPTPEFFEDLHQFPCKLKGQVEGWCVYDRTRNEIDEVSEDRRYETECF